MIQTARLILSRGPKSWRCREWAKRNDLSVILAQFYDEAIMQAVSIWFIILKPSTAFDWDVNLVLDVDSKTKAPSTNVEHVWVSLV